MTFGTQLAAHGAGATSDYSEPEVTTCSSSATRHADATAELLVDVVPGKGLEVRQGEAEGPR